VSAVTEPVAILSTSKNPVAARAFVDFLLSQEGQDLARAQGYIAAHPAVALPAGYPARDAVKVMPFDAKKTLASETAIRKTFADVFGQ
jgi:iron(III) transport system substrate-binding protein